ncbi:ImmA/IrrE family metallo-endopeptidase [Paenibacillus oleatilyticus]|uniref:ImmA/IrrE family metallo-endopeptidase n=1 Tax=Paenibacillus oleatilyticus TaxID=2594886 RepID=UPI001C1F5049|nr:ImmA/IrrE family metallo-endopeptidase [Paenibacillus oleatilyticus]MBU7320314.1 ImmA/IrrE family metallo-endopeptidase [Paenibacillus oleatilyticus]
MQKIIPKLIRRFGTNDPFVISAGLNIHIRFADLGPDTRGLYFRKLRRRCIFIHEQLDEHWQRFVCAHELGHDRLHPGFSRFWLDEHTLFNPGKYERQANKFAVHLLTANDLLENEESIQTMLRRNCVPEEMYKFYL